MAINIIENPFEIFTQKLRWIKRIVAADAPGFVFFGGELDPADFGLMGYDGSISLSGKGTVASEAFAGCIGEGIEHLSRLEWGDEKVVRGTCYEIDHGLDHATLVEIVKLAGYSGDRQSMPEIDWMPAVRLSDAVSVRVPLNLCLRRPADRASRIPSAISTGSAAGPTLEAATLAAILELIERDAVALWWIGGRRAGSFGLNMLGQTGAIDLLQQLREGKYTRPTWLLNLTSDIGIPCVGALSTTASGKGFAFGAAARLKAADAVRAALLELCQSELGHDLVEAKRKVRGDEALNDVDRRKLERGLNLDSRCSHLLHPFGFPEDFGEIEPIGNDAEGLGVAVKCLQRIGVEPLLVELTKTTLPLPAARVIAPGLQPFPSSLITDRLSRSTANLGTRAAEPVGMPLF